MEELLNTCVCIYARSIVKRADDKTGIQLFNELFDQALYIHTAKNEHSINYVKF
jgi:hypothetical protein